MHGKNLPGIRIIFQKDKEQRNYEKNALLLQDILLYILHIKNGNNSFRVWDLAKWLLENNLEFYNSYHGPFSSYTTTISNRVEARSDRIKARINDLVNLGLIHENGIAKATKGNGTVILYRHTELGFFLALYIQIIRPQKTIGSKDRLSDLFNTLLQNQSSSVETFCSFFFNKCYEKGLLGDIQSHLKDILESERKIESIYAIFEHLIFIPMKKIKGTTQDDIWNLWMESLNKLDLRVKELFLYRTKRYLETMIEENIKGFAEYEKVRFKLRSDPKLIAVEGRCNECKSYSIKEFDIIEYMGKLHSLHSQPLIEKCLKCKGHRYSVEFPIAI